MALTKQIQGVDVRVYVVVNGVSAFGVKNMDIRKRRNDVGKPVNVL